MKNTKSGEIMHDQKEYIAVFDSGLGGISVLKELVKLMPRERYLYFGDSANAPYGDRTTEEVRALTLSAAEQLLGRGVKALVVACNTATAAAIGTLREIYPETIIIGIEPAVKVAADRCGSQVGVMATAVTLREEKLNALMEKFPDSHFHPICPQKLVPLIESNATDREIEDYLRPILEPYAGKLDAVVLGCTHYPFAAGVIGKILGSHTQILDGGAGTARETRRRLAEQGLLYEGPGEIQMESSSGDAAFLERGMVLLREEQIEV